ncbi:thiopurine S-methyltransferase [Fodinibius sediminis]|uniref:thiopurine S-methyltransferase n=2 Tax=Fodinibius sediminis TaxID=1214077 RepID=A0A521AGK5_9BACT|nr:thiopurine S-methyltransferase [Fodinibius sediminis]
MTEVYAPLTRYWSRLQLPKQARVLVPLCGKAHDLDWLADQGYHVIGAEAAQRPLMEVMERSNASFVRTESHGFTVYRSESMELWHGNFLKLPIPPTAPIDAIYDKTSIVALPPAMREQHARKLLSLSQRHTQMLLQSFEYVQEEMNGPPFSVPEQEIATLFGADFKYTLLHEESKIEQLERFRRRGLSSHFLEKVYHLEACRQSD